MAAVTAAAILVPALPATAAEGIKIGIVDMKRVFSEYHKTKDAEEAVNEGKAAAKDVMGFAGDIINMMFADVEE